jgi:hypothetical protein
MDGKVWRASHHHVRPGPPVHLLPVGRPHQAAGDQALADHRLPPAVQRDGGEDPQAAESRLKGAASGLKMARTLAIGATGPAHRPERRQRRLGGRAGVRGGVGAAGRIFSAAEPPAAEFLQKLQQVEIPATRPLSYAEVAAKPPAAVLQASHVYVRRSCVLAPLAPLYVGQYEMLGRADKFFRLAVGGREETVSIDRPKPHLGVGPFSAALPAACGHPPTSAPVVVQPQHPPAAATRGGTVTAYSNI